MGNRLAAVLVLVLVGVLAFADAGPPSPRAADAGPGEFSAQRAMTAVGELAREPRPLGSAASDRSRDELLRRLDAAGLDTRVHDGVGAFSREGRASVGAVENVVATLPGTAPTGTIVLAAHYDSVARGPGAADDMASVAAILEAVRALRAGPPLRNDLVVLITDGEESGLLGAQAWVADELARAPRPTVTVNFEARGVSGPSLMFQTSRGNAELVRAFSDAVPHAQGDSSLVEFYRLLPNDTDLTTVLEAGRPGLNFAFIDGAVDYHTTGDNPSNVDPGSVQGHGDAALGLARALGERDLGPLDPAASGAPAQGDRTYFRVPAAMVGYPNALAVPLAALAAIALAGAVLLGRARGLLSVRGTLGAAGATLLAAGIGVGAAIGLWAGIVALRPPYADTGPFLSRPLLFQLADVALAAAVATGLFALLRRRPGRYAVAGGACAVIAALGLATAVALPGMSFLFAWPALGSAAGLLGAVVLRDRPGLATAAVTVGALPAVWLLVPFAWALFGVGGVSDGLPVFALVLTIATLSLVALPHRAERGRAAIPAACLVLTVALAAAALPVDRPSPQHPRAASLAFVQDADTGAARWVSEDTAPADWTLHYVGSEPTDVPAYSTDTPVRTGPAPALPVEGPAVDVVSRTPQRVELRVSSPRGAPTVRLRAERPIRDASVTYPGRPAAVTSPNGNDISLGAVPAAGVNVVLTPAEPGPLGLSVSDASDGLGGVPGFRPRPPDLRGPANQRSDQVVVTRRVPG